MLYEEIRKGCRQFIQMPELYLNFCLWKGTSDLVVYDYVHMHVVVDRT